MRASEPVSRCVSQDASHGASQDGSHQKLQSLMNKTGARQYTRTVFSIFAEIHSIHPISAYIFFSLLVFGSDTLFGVTGMSG